MLGEWRGPDPNSPRELKSSSQSPCRQRLQMENGTLRKEVWSFGEGPTPSCGHVEESGEPWPSGPVGSHQNDFCLKESNPF